MAIPLATVGQVLTADFVNQWLVPLAAYRTSTQSVTSSATLQNDNQLSVTVAANAVYRVELNLSYDGATAGDIQIGWTVPASATMTNVTAMGLTVAAASSTDDATIGTSSNPAFGALGTGTNCALAMTWLLTTAATSGTLQLQWAQGTSSATATRVFAGSHLIAQRVG